MSSIFCQESRITIGGKEVPFRQIFLQKQFRMYMPESFEEDKNLAYRYSYFSNRGKSPLGIAIRYAQVGEDTAKRKMIANYFGGDDNREALPNSGGRILVRESVNSGTFLSIYTMRFAVEVAGGVLFGCFNCDASFKEDWRGAVIEMLSSIEQV